MRFEKYLTEGYNKDNVRELVLYIENDGDSVILVISGTTPITRQKAQYSIKVD